MAILRTVLTIVFIIISVVLAAIVLMQEGKAAGLGAISGAAETYWGKNKGRSMEGTLVKLTKVLGIAFIFMVVLVFLIFKTRYLDYYDAKENGNYMCTQQVAGNLSGKVNGILI